MTTTVGIFVKRRHDADLFWNHCDGPAGRHGDLQLVSSDAGADVAFSFAAPVCPINPPRMHRWRRSWARTWGTLDEFRERIAWRQLELPRERVVAIYYEPRSAIPTPLYDLAKTFAHRVYGADSRATHPIVLPVTWSIPEDVHFLRALPPDPKPLPLVAVSSGEQSLQGHRDRLAFLARLRAENVPFELFGRNIPAPLGSRGQIQYKSSVLRPARLTLVLENDAEGDLYVTEKLWDALLCWSLPIYWGSRAAERLIPADAIIRLPDLGDRGVQTVSEALADPGLWRSRLDAIAEARRRALGELRFPEWLARELAGGGGAWPPSFVSASAQAFG
jgi:hypothetical protein